MSAVEKKRQAKIDYYFGDRTDLPIGMRRAIRAKIEQASDKSIATDQSCEGKHWFLMDFEARSTCPYCDWRLTR
jgi:hypothetical protein